MNSPSRSREANEAGIAALEAADLDAALRLFGESIHFDASNADAWFNLGLVHKRRRQWVELADCSLHAIELSKRTNEGAIFNLGLAATVLGDWRLARRAWRLYGFDVDRSTATRSPEREGDDDQEGVGAGGEVTDGEVADGPEMGAHPEDQPFEMDFGRALIRLDDGTHLDGRRLCPVRVAVTVGEHRRVVMVDGVPLGEHDHHGVHTRVYEILLGWE